MRREDGRESVAEPELLTPADLTELREALSRTTSRSVFLAGGTDLVNLLRLGAVSPDLIVDLSGVRELGGVRHEGSVVLVGATATFTELEADPVLRAHASCLAQAAAQVGSRQIRNVATIGGNVANASPCADAIPALMALDARVTILDAGGDTKGPPVRDVVVGPGATSLAPGEVIAGFRFTPLATHERSAFAKIGSRSAVSVARLSAAVVVGHDPDSGTLSGARVALGAVGETAFRDDAVEESLDGRPAVAATAWRFAEACAEAVCRSIPGRYSLPYKRHAAIGLAYDAWNALAVCPPCEPLTD
jgi:CO/xanthine dehydrogenase FAD-binding subunit